VINSKCFDNNKYLEEQTKEILERVKKFDNKLYLEFGGKLCYDYHAARVLPGYEVDTKMKIFQKLLLLLCLLPGLYVHYAMVA